MAFTVRGLGGLSDEAARQKVNESLAYLKRSALAKSILEDLEEHADVCIDVDPQCEPFYAHPESSYDTITAGGTAVWNPGMNLQTMDSATYRPAQPWVPQHLERSKVTVQKTGLAKKLAAAFKLSDTHTVRRMVPKRRVMGTLSAHMCLMHELGHALQYATYPTEFRGIKADKTLNKGHVHEALEETNLSCVEIPIALELNAVGANETPRWVYAHTGHDWN